MSENLLAPLDQYAFYMFELKDGRRIVGGVDEKTKSIFENACDVGTKLSFQLHHPVEIQVVQKSNVQPHPLDIQDLLKSKTYKVSEGKRPTPPPRLPQHELARMQQPGFNVAPTCDIFYVYLPTCAYATTQDTFMYVKFDAVSSYFTYQAKKDDELLQLYATNFKILENSQANEKEA
jgi:hypothetical protein